MEDQGRNYILLATALIVLAGAFGAIWAAIPAYLQAKRGSHIVITTIMFNFIAAAVLNYVLVNVLRPKGAMDPATARFPEAVHLPTLHDILAPIGINFSVPVTSIPLASYPVNLSANLRPEFGGTILATCPTVNFSLAVPGVFPDDPRF